MKIGILTHYDVSSHGALLQMYALQEELIKMGHDVYILTYNRNYDFVDETTKKRFSASFKNIFYYIKNYMGTDGPFCLTYQYKKQKILKAFRNSNFKYMLYTDSERLDCVIVGADEVFSLENGVNIMMFAHGITSKKIISYAPSFGQTDIKRIDKYGSRELIKSGLEKFTCLSARDIGTRDVIKTLIGYEIPIVCDPALLHRFSIKKKKSDKKYIVIYSYQSNFKETDRIKKIQDYARRNNLELWSVGVYYKWCNKHVNCNPLEMLDVFSAAQAIITDTFHGTISSYIAQTPMAVFVRNNNNVKLNYLLKIMKLEDRKIAKLSDLERVLDSKMDFSKINNAVEELREFSKSYLENALEN